MYVRFDPDKDTNNSESFAYKNWAKTYKVDLSKNFIVIGHYREWETLIYECLPPPSLQGQVEKVHLRSNCFSPVDVDIKLENYQ